ncbi:MAG: hypothetical protein WD042_02350 [Phycisphaeraceae bacterium]
MTQLPSDLPTLAPAAPLSTALPRLAVKSRAWLWVTLGVGVPMVLFGLCVLTGVLLVMLGTDKPLPVTNADRAVVVNAELLAEWRDDFTPDAAHETITSKRWPDKGYSVEYEYDEPANDDSPYLSCMATFDVTERIARTTNADQKDGALRGVQSVANVVLQERNDIYRWGDESAFYVMMAHGKPTGNCFMARKGPRTVILRRLFR